MKTHTFRPTSNRQDIFSELSKNVEGVCAKARRHGLKARGVTFFLKTQDFQYYTRSIELPIALSDATELLRAITLVFDEVYDERIVYRASGITLRLLLADTRKTYDLFGEVKAEEERSDGTLRAVDAMNQRYGRHTVFLASSLKAVSQREESLASREGRRTRMPVEARRKTLNIPYLGKVH